MQSKANNTPRPVCTPVFFPVILLILTAVICASCSRDILSYVPQSALLVLETDNVNRLLGQADTQLNTYIPRELVKSLMYNQTLSNLMVLGLTFMGIPADQLNLDGPACLAVYPASDPMAVNSMVICSLNPKNKDNKALAKSIESALVKKGILAENYQVRADRNFIIFAPADYFVHFPPAKKLRLQGEKKLKKSNLKLFVNIPAALPWLTQKTWDELKQTVIERSQELGENSLPTPTQTAQTDLIGALAGAAFTLLEQLQDCEIHYSFGDKAVNSYSLLSLKAGSSLGKYLKKIKTAAGAEVFLKYLPDNFDFAMINNADPQSLTAAGDYLFSLYKPLFSPTDQQELIRISRQLSGTMGNLSAVAVNLGITMPQQEDSYEFMLELLHELKFTLVVVTEIKNSLAFQTAYRQLVTFYYQVLNLNELLELENCSIKAEFATNLKENAFSYDKFYFTVTEKGSGEADRVPALITAILKNFELYVGYTDSRCYFTCGYDSFNLLKNLMTADTLPYPTLAAHPALKTFKNRLEKANIFLAFSTDHFIRSLLHTLSPAHFPEPSPDKHLDSFTSFGFSEKGSEAYGTSQAP